MTTSILKAMSNMAAGKVNGDKPSPLDNQTPSDIKGCKQCSSILKQVVNSRSASNPLPVPQQAFGFWG